MDFGKSLCVLCRRALAQASLVASPSDCPTHYFHFECLAKHATSERRCPIDKIPFDNITCIDEAISPDQEAEKNTASSNDKVKTEGNGGTDKKMQNTDPMPALAGMTISNEEDSNKDAVHSPAAGKKILIAKEAGSGTGVPMGGDINAGNVRCEICKSTSPGERTSPDCCEHWFHRTCFDNYVRAHSLCPVRNCYREISTYSRSSGLRGGIQMTVECEYRNMASAPEGFECNVCHEANLGKHRAIAKPCGHMFHRHCLMDFVRDNKKCPTCQKPTKLITGCTSGDLRDMQFD